MREAIFQKLNSVRQRQWSVTIASAFVSGLAGGAALVVGMSVLRLVDVWQVSAWESWSVLLGVPLLSVVISVVLCRLRSDWLPAARAIDGHYELKDRTETALAFLRRQPSGSASDWEQLQVADALRHLQSVEPTQVVPLKLPSSWRWVALSATIAVVLICWPTSWQKVNAGPSLPNDAIVSEAEQVEEDLKELAEQLPEEHDPELDALIKELQAKAEEMKEPGVDVREALAKLSEMQTAIQALAVQFNVATADEELKAIGEALQSAQALEQAGQAMQAGEFDKAAEELTKLDSPQLDRKEQRAVSEKLKKVSESAGQKGLNKLSQAAKEAAEGLNNDTPSQSKEGLSKLGECCKKQAQSKKISDLLKNQLNKLGESKGNCQSQGNGNKLAKNPSTKAGRGTNSEVIGERTSLASKNNRENVTGQKGEQGDTETETLTTHESEEQAQRGYKDVYQKYRKLSDTVLENDDIPLGHRQTIRRYFEAIRPNREGVSPESKKAD